MLGELLVIGDIGIGLDDIGQGVAGGFKAGLDVFGDLLELGRHIALADVQPPCVLRANWPATKIILPMR